MNGRLSAFSGEYLDKAVEAAFRKERFHETVRMSRIYLLVSAVVNVLFLFSDWRFYGDPHFWVAIPARVFVVAISLFCACLNECVRTPRGAQIVLVFYEICVAIAVGFLVTSHSVLAIFAVIALPAIYYLALPTSFAVTITMGGFCSVALLVGFMTRHPEPGLETGLILAMFTINTALTIIVSKGNRLRRLEWAAAQATLRANEELDASRKMLEKIFMAVPIPLIVTEHDSGRVLHANRAASRYFGGLEHIRQQDSIKLIYADPRQRDELIATIDACGHVDGFEIAIALKDGTKREMLLSGSRIELDGKDCVITGGVDISARKALEARLEELATRDPLTHVLNRTAFLERATAEIDRARRACRPLSVMMMDLDYSARLSPAQRDDDGPRLLQAHQRCVRPCGRRPHPQGFRRSLSHASAQRRFRRTARGRRIRLRAHRSRSPGSLADRRTAAARRGGSQDRGSAAQPAGHDLDRRFRNA
jgi:diguanylate cyclase